MRALSGELARRIRERGEVRGECVVVVEGPSAEELSCLRAACASGPATLEEAIAEGLDAGEPKSALAKRLAKQFGIPKYEVYDKLV